MDDGKTKPVEKAHSEKTTSAAATVDSKEDIKTQRALKRLKTTLVDATIGETSVKRLRSGPKDEGGPIIVRIVGGKLAEEGSDGVADRPEPRGRSRSVSRVPRRRSFSEDSLSDSSVAASVKRRARSRSTSLEPDERVIAKQKKEEAEEEAKEVKFCWICHKADTQFNCRYCPRSFHGKCMGAATMADGLCLECAVGMKAETVTYRSMEQNSLEKLRPLLQYTLDRMKNVEDSQHFWKPVSKSEHPKYSKVIRYPMDLEKLEMNLRNDVYGSTAAFHADAKWIQHNSVVYNSNQSHFTAVARAMLKVCKQELEEIDKCPDCYMNAHNCDDWFIQVCRRPHILVWARLKGFPFWPAKVLAVNLRQQNVDARFFGAHDRAWVPTKDCYLLSKNCPTSYCKKKGDIEAAFEEMYQHIAKIKAKFGFVYAPDKVPYVPEIETQQLSSMMPGWKPPTENIAAPEKEESGEEGVVADMDGICEREANVEKEAEVAASTENNAAKETPQPARTPEHGYSAVEGPTSNGNPAQSLPRPPSSPKKKSLKPAETNHKEKSKSAPKPPEPSHPPVKTVPRPPGKGAEPMEVEEEEENNVTDADPPAQAPKLKTIEIEKNRRPMVTIVDINRLGMKAGPSNAEGIKHKLTDEVSFVVVPKDGNGKTSGMKRVLLNPMATVKSKARKSIPQAVNQDNAVTISTSSAVASKGLNQGVNVIAVDTRNSDAQRNLLKTLAGNGDKTSRTTEDAPPAKDGPEKSTGTGTTSNVNAVPNGPFLINGQAFTIASAPNGPSILTQNNSGQISLVQLSALPGNINHNYVNLSNEGGNAPPPYPALMQTASPLYNGSVVVGPNAASTSAAVTPATASPKTSVISVKKTLFDVDPIEAEVKKHLPKLTDQLHEAMVQALKSIGDSLPSIQMRIVNADRETTKKQHQKVVDDLRIDMERNKRRMESEFQRKLADKQFELEKVHEDYRRIIEQTKSKQWCALCRKEALFYCCWNTSYCNYPCQQQHWVEHMSSCAQVSKESPVQMPNQLRRRMIMDANAARAAGFDPASMAEVQLRVLPEGAGAPRASTYNGPASRKKP